ncbi:neutral zinc metallopeptidase [Metapseudomonas resinovorans]|uniref:neutral zinc metallopeptidase n=1 Tax=Metapseudomonas resinovorans TaxID=53412 RepID=UPI000425F243|nr:neutral zinc metallopeptidase [Pseudomonas resinovorans]
MPEKTAAPMPRKGLLLRLLRILAWLLIVVALLCVSLYLAFGPARLIDRLAPPPPTFPENTIEAPSAPVAAAPVPAPVQAPADSRELVTLMIDSIEDIWGEFLARGDYAYKKPKVEVFEDRIEDPCTLTGSFSGSFYCPKGMRLYIDLAYLDELQKRAPQVGDLARSYAVAHTAAHHVLNLVGAVGWFKEYHVDIDQAKRSERLQESQELVADCLVGSWISYAQHKYAWMKPQDLPAAVKAVTELSKERTAMPGKPGMLDPLALVDAETRMRWLQVGIETGDPRECSQMLTESAE